MKRIIKTIYNTERNLYLQIVEKMKKIKSNL